MGCVFPTETGRRRLIVHADDFGMCHSVNQATFYAFDQRVISSASIMVPCNWFVEAAQYCLKHINYDIGVHLTLTSEWNGCRWRPLTGDRNSEGLVDETGHFHSVPGKIRAGRACVEAELSMQIQAALGMGLTLSHIDTHMFVGLYNQSLLDAYVSTARNYGLPFLYNPRSRRVHSEDQDIRIGNVRLEQLIHAPADVPPRSLEDFYVDALRSLAPGVSQLIVHPGFDDTELQALAGSTTPWGADWRQRDLDFLLSRNFRAALEEGKIELVSWADLRDTLTADPVTSNEKKRDLD
jgi:predicted glycoside hydrolase/deacetylase ChbG (UPF0249 family)